MDHSPLQLLRADWVAPFAPGAERLIRDGGVVVDAGRIAAVGLGADLARLYPDAIETRLTDAILLPGLVNPHVHLELSDLRPGLPPAGGFAPWLLELVRRSAGGAAQVSNLVSGAIEEGVRQCLRFGVTSVGDITRHPAMTRPLLAGGPLRVTSYGEIQALAKRRTLFPERFNAAADITYAGDRLRIGLSPHAPYTVEPKGYAACLAAAKRDVLPLATHLAESPGEAGFLADHAGPFRALWETLGQWDDAVPVFTGGPIRFAQSLGLLDYPTLLAHVNYCDDVELELLAAGRASVVYCPRTHRHFGHPPHRWRDMLARGVNVAVGTDSCASSPDLNLVDDLRLVRDLAPEVPAHELWEMVTTRAARAIGAGATVGSLTPGKFADFVAFPAATDDPLAAVLRRGDLPVRTWIS